MFPPELTSELTPLFVTAPTTRCGTTLLQRLICSAPNAILFGETVAADLQTALGVTLGRAQLYSMHREFFVTKLAALRNGGVNEWLIDLTPDLAEYLVAMRASYEALLLACRDSAARDGRTVYGVKYPGIIPPLVNALRLLLPQSKWIFIHRELDSCLRSAKARGDLQHQSQLQQYCQEWNANMEYLLSLPPDERTLVLRYDELRADANAFIDRVEAFTGAKPIDRSVLQHRVNDPSGYLQPVELTNEERSVAETIAGVTRKSVYGT